MADAKDLNRTVGHYRLSRELGRGGQGAVYLAEDTRLSRKVALKLLSSGFGPSRDTLLRFQREAAAASRLDHPGICAVYETGEADGHHYIAMRHIEGQTLAKLIDGPRAAAPAAAAGETLVVESPGAPPAPGLAADKGVPAAAAAGSTAASAPPSTRAEVFRMVQLIERVARALHVAHEANLIHRDIKPGNIMVTKEGEPVILDFGLARDEDSAIQTVTHSGDLVGTPAYMSPEQLLAQRVKLDHRTDIYSLGVTLYECLTFRRPFDHPSRDGLYQQILAAHPPDPCRLNRHLPRDLKVVLETALDRDRDRRYRTALDFADDLQRVRNYEPIHARPAGPVLRFRRWTQRNPVLATGILGLFLFLSVGLAVSLVLLRQVENQRGIAQLARKNAEIAAAETTKVLAVVQSERDAKARALVERQDALTRAEGLKLTAQASSALPDNPGLALLLGIEASRWDAGPVLSNVLVEALQLHREEKVIRAGEGGTAYHSFSRDGRVLVSSPVGTAGAVIRDPATGKILIGLGGFAEPIVLAAFSADGTRVLISPRWPPEPALWDLRSGKLLATLRGHQGVLTCVSFSPGGDRLVTGSQDATARVWDASSGEQVAVHQGHQCGIISARFTPDGERVLTTDEPIHYVFSQNGDGSMESYSFLERETTARVWDARSGVEVLRLGGHDGRVTAAQSPDGRLILTAGERNTPLRVWNAANGELLAKLEAPWRVASSAAFSPDSKRLLTVSNRVRLSGRGEAGEQSASVPRDFVSVWEVGSWKERERLLGHGNVVHAAGFSPDGTRIVTASEDTVARVWDSASGELLLEFRGHQGGVLTAEFSSDGRQVYTTSSDGTARVWEADPRNRFATVPVETGGSPRSVLFSPDGSLLLTVAGEVGFVWNTATGKRLARVGTTSTAAGWLRSLGVLESEPRRIDFAAFTPDSKRVLTVCRESAQVWEAQDGKLVASWKGRPRLLSGAMERRADISADGLRVISVQGAEQTSAIKDLLSGKRPTSGGYKEEAVIWNAATGKLELTLRGDTGFIRAVAFSGNAQRALTFGQDSSVRFWDALTGSFNAASSYTRGGLYSAVLSPDGQRAALVEWRNQVRVISATTGARLSLYTGHGDNITSAVFSPDAQRVLTSSSDHTARVWDASSGEELAVMRGHIGSVSGASFTRDGQRVVTWSEDQTARVWSASGQELIILPHGEVVQSAAFTPDGAGVMSISASNIPRIWPLDLVGEARKRKAREFSPDELDRFEIGEAGERKAHRRRTETEGLLEEIEVQWPFPKDSVSRNARVPLARRLARLGSLLAGASPEEVKKAVIRSTAAIDRLGIRDPEVLAALADLLVLDGQRVEALAMLETARRGPGATAHLEPKLEKLRAALLPDLASYDSLDAALEAPDTILPEKERWRFLRGRGEPSPGLEWTEESFDDSGWEEGPSGFGFGDEDDATVLADMKGSYSTVYLRRVVDLDPAVCRRLDLSVIADDGFVAYLNGGEIGRARAGRPGQRVSFDGLADVEAVEPVAPVSISLPLEKVRPGKNLLAVQGINRSKASSDLSLIPVLRAEFLPDLERDRRRLRDFRAVAQGTGAPGSGAQSRLAYLDGRILERSGNHGEALAKFVEAAERDRMRPEPLLRLAEVERVEGNARRAMARLRDALTSGVEGKDSLWEAWIRIGFGELKQTAAAMEAALPPGPAGEDDRRGEDFRWLLRQLSIGKGTVRIQCGGPGRQDRAGTVWGRDAFFHGGYASLSRSWIVIGGTEDPDLCRTNRWFPVEGRRLPGYRIPLPTGRYRVTLHGAETFFSAPGQRRFDVLLEGRPVLTDYQPEPLRAALATADRKTFEVEVDDGALDLEFVHRVNNPQVSALEIESLIGVR